MKMSKYQEVYDKTSEMMRDPVGKTRCETFYFKAYASYFLEEYEESLKLFYVGKRKSPKHKMNLFRNGIRY